MKVPSSFLILFLAIPVLTNCSSTGKKPLKKISLAQAHHKICLTSRGKARLYWQSKRYGTSFIAQENAKTWNLNLIPPLGPSYEVTYHRPKREIYLDFTLGPQERAVFFEALKLFFALYDSWESEIQKAQVQITPTGYQIRYENLALSLAQEKEDYFSQISLQNANTIGPDSEIKLDLFINSCQQKNR